jgi:hypothetical protein
MSVNFKKFERAFNESANSEENLLDDGSVNWNFVDADLNLDGWADAIGEDFYAIFDDMANKFDANKKI